MPAPHDLPRGIRKRDDGIALRGACRRKEDAAFSGIERNGRNFLFQPFRHPKPVGFHAVGKRDRGIVSAAVAAHRSVEHILAGLADDIAVGGSVPAQVDGRHRRLHGRQCRRSRTPRLAVAVGDGQRHGRFRRSCGRRNIERACVGIPLAPGRDDNRPTGEGLIRLGGESQPLQIVARHREGEPLLLPDRKFDGILPGEPRFSVRPVSVPVRCRYSPMQTGPANILRSVFSSFIRFWLNTVPFRRTAKMKRHTPTHTQQSARSPASEVVFDTLNTFG